MPAGTDELLCSFNTLETTAPLKNAVATAQSIAEKMQWRTRAVSVLSPDQVKWPGAFDSDWVKQFDELGRKKLSKVLNRNGFSATANSTVLLEPFHSQKGTVRAVAEEAKRSKSQAIAVFTHAKKSKSKLHNFVSSIVHAAETPILVLNAAAPRSGKIRSVIFASDFSREDIKSFKKAVEMARRLQAELVIVHVLPDLANEMMQSYAGIAGGWTQFESYFNEEIKRARQTAQAWAKRALASGVKVSTEILNHAPSIPNAILKVAKSRPSSLIVVTEKTGPLAAFFLGSVTRAVLEKSEFPVFVLPQRTLRRSSRGARK